MTNRDTDRADKASVILAAVYVGIVALALGLIVGSITGYNRGVKEASSATTTWCIEQPKKCKLSYDYYHMDDVK